MKKFVFVLWAAFIMLLSSCSGDHYLNVIPRGCTALVAIDPQQTEEMSVPSTQVFQTLFPDMDLHDGGLDLSSKFYLFESAEGNLGLVAKISDEGKVDKMINKLIEKGDCQKVIEKKGVKFTVCDQRWVIGYHDYAMMVIGPVIAAQQMPVMQQMIRYLKQDEKAGITGSRFFQKLDSIVSPISMVAQVSALPEQLSAPFILGAPKDADASQVVLATKIEVQQGILYLRGNTYSYNKTVQESIQSASSLFRPMSGRFVNNLNDRMVLSFLTNVDGKRFLPVLQQSRGFKDLLTGANTAIDMNSVINSLDGDLMLSFSAMDERNMRMVMGAQVGDTDFWKEADYWRKTAPRDFWFTLDEKGAMKKSEFLCGNEEVASLAYRQQPQVATSLAALLEGQRLCMLLQLNALDKKLSQTIGSFIRPLFGDIKTIVYSLEDPLAVN